MSASSSKYSSKGNSKGSTKRSFVEKLRTEGFDVKLLKEDGRFKSKTLKLNSNTGELELLGRKPTSNLFSVPRKFPKQSMVMASSSIRGTSFVTIEDDENEIKWKLLTKPTQTEEIIIGLENLHLASSTKPLVIERFNLERPEPTKKEVYVGKEKGSTPREVLEFYKYGDQEVPRASDSPRERPPLKSALKKASVARGLRSTKRKRSIKKRSSKSKRTRHHRR
jgi:hypothetical protein